jgi:predicted transcriptional regulator
MGESRVLVVTTEEAAPIVHALNVPLRRKILLLLAAAPLNVNAIAERLAIPQSTCATSIQILEAAGLVRSEQLPAVKGAQKVCRAAYEEIVITVGREGVAEDEHLIETEMPIGLFTDFSVSPPCGLLSTESIIGFYDQTSSFMDPRRATAALIWFTRGYLVYRFPRNYSSWKKVSAISVTMELCSEFPGYRNDWPSDITLSINGLEIGTWTSPGDMGGIRGRFTPSWWDLRNSQFGYLKSWRISRDGSYIDGVRVSDTKLEDLHIESADSFLVKIGVDDGAENLGGINIFGRGFGNYEQDLVFRVELD